MEPHNCIDWNSTRETDLLEIEFDIKMPEQNVVFLKEVSES